MELIPWAELPAYVQAGVVGSVLIALFIPLGLIAMQCYDYDYFHDSDRALAAYHDLMFLAGSLATLGGLCLLVSALLRSGLVKVL